jgi:hypothetical protein
MEPAAFFDCDFSIGQFYSQLKLGFEIVTSSHALTHKGVPGSSLEFLKSEHRFLLKDGIIVHQLARRIP